MQRNNKCIGGIVGGRKCFEVIILVVSMVWLATLYGGRVNGDASIYFTFFKNFFIQPFSFYPGQVSYGATSPLFVILGGSFYFIFGDIWDTALTLFGFLLCGGALFLLNRTICGGFVTLLPMILVFVLCKDVLSYVGMLYEVPLILFAVALLIYCIKYRLERSALIVNGSLYLVRPEMAILSLLIFLFLFYHSKQKKSFLVLGILSYVPCILYSLYMLFYTGDFLPSSAVGRYIFAVEEQVSWFQAVTAALTFFWYRYYGLITIVFITTIVYYVKWQKLPMVILIIIIGVLCPYILFPPHPGYIIRYTAAFVMPVCIACGYFIHIFIECIKRHQRGAALFVHGTICLVSLVVLVFIFLNDMKSSHTVRPNYGYMLGIDLAAKLNPLVHETDNILMYEIQAQYSMGAHCISMDAIVGSHMVKFLLGKQSFETALRENNVSYIVSMNGINYRRIFANTTLVNIYMHDLNSSVGDILELRGIRYEKILTNPFFSDINFYTIWEGEQTYNDATNQLRLVSKNAPKEAGGPNPWWNSVYRVSIID